MINNQKNILNKNNDIQFNEQLLNFYFEQAIDGVFFMMLDEPLEWNDNIDKEAALDYVHQSDYLDSEVIQKKEPQHNEDRYSILYIEDNKDLLDFVSNKFSTEYTFFTSDGCISPFSTQFLIV